MTNKDKYRILCKGETSIPIFNQDWWLDEICGEDNWDVLLVEANNKIIGAHPYYKVNLIRDMIVQPLFTPINGIMVWPPEEYQETTNFSFEKKTYSQLIEQLDGLGLAFYNQCFHYTFLNWLPFFWKGYHQTTRYTYVLDDLQNPDKVWNGITSKRRNEIRKAQKNITVKETEDIGILYRLSSMTYTRQGKPVPYSYQKLKQLDAACKKNDRRRVTCALDQEGNIHAVMYIIWDDMSAYYLIGGVNPDYGGSGAMSLLIWNAIQFCAEKGIKFDFEGSMIEPIEFYFSSFGAVQKPYFNVWKGSWGGWLLYFVYKAGQRITRRYFTLRDRGAVYAEEI